MKDMKDYRFPVVFDKEKFFSEYPNDDALKKLKIDFGNSANYPLVKKTLKELTKDLFRKPTGVMKYPYIVPGSVYNQLWDWDAFFCGLGVCEEQTEYYKGSVLNFLDHMREDGRPPHRITPEKAEYESLSLPLFAQWCAIIVRITNDIEWLKPWWESLCRQRKWFEQTCRARRGLFRLSQWAGHGLDNDPVIYGRQPNRIAPVHVNCYHYREYVAMAALAEKLNDSQQADSYASQARELAEAMNTYMWDEKDGIYYHLDLSDFDDIRDQEITWEIPYKIKSWACLFPLWAGICSKRQAERMVTEHIMNPDEFLSEFGIRSLSADERMYNNELMANPSNWQGPVWGMSTFLVSYSLLKYGYLDEALKVAGRLIDVFASDIQTNGFIHEFYNAETGDPVMRPGFLSWNLIGCRIIDDIKTRHDPSGF